MQVDVYDTYATSASGGRLHFDVLVAAGTDADVALRHARGFLQSIGAPAEALRSERCRYCHTELADGVIVQAIAASGHFILRMEGCPPAA